MYKPRVFGLTIIILCLTGVRAQAQSASSDLPAGEMQVKARTACTECHDARIVLQQRLSKAAWTREVDKMMKWGALVDAKDRDALIDYFSTNFPTDKPNQPAPRAARASK